ncbi:MAG: hypothetical protein NZ958_02055 [Bacteroidia bacterium]|nr:hypothetical protein [Bacteroidia bacterium]MDW8089127.1 hypothetical protein [Bacteroidia bacterium]
MRALAVALIAAGMYLLVGCGGQQQEQKPSEPKATEQVQPTSPDTAAAQSQSAPAPGTQPAEGQK